MFGLALRAPLPGHLLAPIDQRVQVNLARGVHVELGCLAVLQKNKTGKNRAFFTHPTRGRFQKLFCTLFAPYAQLLRIFLQAQ